MQRESRCLAMLLFCLALASPAFAGPNEDGVIILHAIPYQSRNAPPPCNLPYDLVDCEDANVSVPGFGTLWAWFVIGVFPDGSSPRVNGVTFGIEYAENTVVVLDLEGCGDFELPTSQWPASGNGTAVTWQTSQTENLVKIYAFAGYEYYGEDTAFCLTPHPTQGGSWADDSVPALLDPIADFGCLGFNTNPGYLPCPGQTAVAACCLPGGPCQMVTEEDCVADGGDWIGPGTDCDPDPCVVPASETTWGRVKRQFR